MLLNYGVGEDSWESLGLQGNPTSPFWRRSVLKIHWKDWCWTWSSNTLATWYEEPTHWERPWCWERLKAGGEGDDRGWDGWMASLTQWTWVWISSGRWWTGKPGVLQSMGSQRVGHDWATELNKYFRVFAENDCRDDICYVSTCISLGWEDPLEKELTTHSNILDWQIPWREEPGRLLTMGSQTGGHDLATKEQQEHVCHWKHFPGK